MDNEEQSAILSGRALGLRDGATKEKFDIAMKMAQWKDEQFAVEKQALIENACEWLRRNVNLYIAFYGDEACIEKSSLIKNLRKAMEA